MRYPSRLLSALILGSLGSLGVCPPGAAAREEPVPITINYTPANLDLFETVALPDDRLLFMRGQVLNGIGWPPENTRGRVVTTWPSWREAQQHEVAWAPFTDVFGYDIEADSPPEETENVARTIQEILAYLALLAQQYGHPILLSAGLNYNFGTQHALELAQADEVHIHANELLRVYPASGPHGENYVEWAVARASQVREANPGVRIQLAVLVPGMEASLAIQVTEDLSREMEAAALEFQGLTMWAETDVLAAFLSWLRPAASSGEGPSSAKGAWIEQIAPNPSRGLAEIRLALPRRSPVLVELFDAAGRQVGTVVEGELDPGERTLLLETRGAASGAYYCRLRTPYSAHSRRITVLK
ncbi:MAG: hypothetical protein FJY88_10290 [Candidatus Eisenbacteria bacterium]|nr:hypothetical protein [Candidatus Eisenbacteria bacterium]